MTKLDGHLADSNPFSTRFVRPGAIAYLWPAGDSASEAVLRLARAGWRGQIVGPHGSGKSTLLASLIEPLEQAGHRGHLISLHDGRGRMPGGWQRQARHAGARLIIVDGYEQLSRWQRVWVQACCRLRGWGMLVTAHDDVGLPVLVRTAPDVASAQAVVERLLPPGDRFASQEMIAQCFAAARGDVREMLFALYDRYERHAAGR